MQIFPEIKQQRIENSDGVNLFKPGISNTHDRRWLDEFLIFPSSGSCTVEALSWGDYPNSETYFFNCEMAKHYK